MSKLSQKWARAPWARLSEITDTTVRDNMAQLIENENRELSHTGLLTEDLNPNYSVGIGPGVAPTDSGIAIGSRPAGNIPAGGDQMGALAPMSFAVLRRTFPALFANKVVGVQAMSAPVSMVMAQRFVYQGTTDEAGWDKVPLYQGFTGNFNGATGVEAASGEILDKAAAQDPQIAEAWRLRAPIPNAGEGPFDQPITAQATDKYPELSYFLARMPVLAKTRKLGASYSIEAIMDAKAVLNLDLEKELLNQIQYELVAEQDREIINTMIRTAQNDDLVSTNNADYGYTDGFQQNFSCRNGGIKGLTLDLTNLDGNGSEARWQQEQISVLVTYIMGLANSIAVATRRGAGNFAIVSPGVATLLEAAGPVWNRTPSTVNALDVTPEIGTLGSKIKVYRDQYALEDYVLVGYKGPASTDAGIIFAPYVTGLESRAVSAQNFSPRIGVMSRYALVENLLGAGRYYRYAKITLPNSLNANAKMFRPVGL